MRKTKVIATIGPTSRDASIIEEMIINGVDAIRINMSHANFDFCDEIIKKVRKIEKKLNKTIGIMLDTEGPSIRLDKLIEDKVFLAKDKEIKLYGYQVVSSDTQISTNYDKILDILKKDSEILLSNGTVSLKVIDIKSDNAVCKVIEEGYIYSRQTIHIKNVYKKIPFINSKERETIFYAIKQKVDFLALSYVRDEQDVLDVIDILIEEDNDHISIISKIENDDAFNNLDEILKISDGVMVARGDLGVEMPLEKLPYYQKFILDKAIEHEKIGLVATDLLSSMENDIRPSRAEVSDIYNSVMDKCDGMLLCGETTIGKYPVETVKAMINIIKSAENDFDYNENLIKIFRQTRQDITTSISYSVVDSSLRLQAKCILANTMSGYTVKKISHFKPKCIILGLSPNINTVRSLTITYGVIPILTNTCRNTDEIIDECIKKFKEYIPHEKSDIVIITGGFPLDNKNTNFMKIEKIN